MELIGFRKNCLFTNNGKRYAILEQAESKYRPAKCVELDSLDIKYIHSWEECRDVKELTENEMFNVKKNIENYGYFSSCMCLLFLGLMFICIIALCSM